MSSLLPIARISAETGIAKEVLRKWETRYGFPVPVRDDQGNRAYTDEQLQRLLLVRRLLDHGMRPGQVVALEHAQLASLVETMRGQEPAKVHPLFREVVGWLKSRDPELVRERLREEIQRCGLQRFVSELMPAMNIVVGNSWETGELTVREEHLYTEIIQRLLGEMLVKSEDRGGQPRVLLATVQGEAHTLGLLMLESFLTEEGAYCISLGAQVPDAEMAPAASEYGADILALSFSASFPKKKVVPILKSIRAGLPPDVALWAGGAGARDLERTPRGVHLFDTLQATRAALAPYRKRLRPHGA